MWVRLHAYFIVSEANLGMTIVITRIIRISRSLRLKLHLSRCRCEQRGAMIQWTPVLSFLDAIDVVRLGRTSLTWKERSESDSVWISLLRMHLPDADMLLQKLPDSSSSPYDFFVNRFVMHRLGTMIGKSLGEQFANYELLVEVWSTAPNSKVRPVVTHLEEDEIHGRYGGLRAPCVPCSIAASMPWFNPRMTREQFSERLRGRFMMNVSLFRKCDKKLLRIATEAGLAYLREGREEDEYILGVGDGHGSGMPEKRMPATYENRHMQRYLNAAVALGPKYVELLKDEFLYDEFSLHIYVFVKAIVEEGLVRDVRLSHFKLETIHDFGIYDLSGCSILRWLDTHGYWL